MEPQMALDFAPVQPMRRKRKAETQEGNERLSKRLSLLNLERDGSKLYVPVENPTAPPSSPVATPSPHSSSPIPTRSSPPRRQSPRRHDASDGMQLDSDASRDAESNKYKVYIYNLDDELSSESEPEDGRLVFLPDIEKHLREQRRIPGLAGTGTVAAAPPSIPRPVMANSDGELAGMQLVLYSVPSAITVPEERDGVRRAVIEARARLRERQREEREEEERAGGLAQGNGFSQQQQNQPQQVRSSPVALPPIPELATMANGFQDPSSSPWEVYQADPDAMDLS